jgi:hypothetical protein
MAIPLQIEREFLLTVGRCNVERNVVQTAMRI